MDADEFIRRGGKTETLKTVSIWKRLGGFIFDLLVLNLLVFSSFESLISEYIEISSFSIGQQIPTGLYSVILLAGIFSLAYFSLMEYTVGSTLGMMLFNTRVRQTSDSKYDSPGFWKCVLRNLFILPVFPLTLLWIIEPVYLLWKKKRILEQLTGTETVIIQNG